MERKAKEFAIQDIRRGNMDTLWVKQLREECSDLYEYAVKRSKEV